MCKTHTLDVDYKRGSDGHNKLLVACRSCSRVFIGACAALGVPPGRVQDEDPFLNSCIGLPWGGASTEPAPLPTPDQIEAWRRRLNRTPAAVAYLCKRGINAATCRRYKLGYDHRRAAITIPVYSAAGEIVNLRQRFLSPANPKRKIKGLRGHPASLYPDVPTT